MSGGENKTPKGENIMTATAFDYTAHFITQTLHEAAQLEAMYYAGRDAGVNAITSTPFVIVDKHFSLALDRDGDHLNPRVIDDALCGMTCFSRKSADRAVKAANQQSPSAGWHIVLYRDLAILKAAYLRKTAREMKNELAELN